MHELWVWWLLLWPLALIGSDEARCNIWLRRSVLLLLLLLTVRYLHWRLTASLNLTTAASTSLSWLLLLAEAWLLLSGLLPLALSWRRFDDGRATAERAAERWQESDWRPHVDVLVPTCGEPLAVLERCLLGCTGLDYPHVTVWVLDDSGRDSVRDLAQSYGCRYRHRGERRHAKAGNLNDGLSESSGELVAVLDADFVPQHRFLECTIGLLADPTVGLVQTPQVFFNADPLMRNLGMERWMLPDEDNFYRWIEPVRSAWGAVVCAGTAFVARRSALEQIGGFVEGALSEDFVTGIALLGRGWTLRYLGEPLCAGLAAETLLDFVRQRQRWAAGTLQSLRLAEGPLRQRGLRPGQRLALLEGCLHWLNTLPRLLVLLLPLSYGLLQVVPIVINGHDLITQLLPLWTCLLLSVGWLNRRSRYALLNELPSWVLSVPLATTVLASLVGRFSGFRITPKQQPRNRGGASPFLVMPLLVLLALQLLNLVLLLRALPAIQAGPAAGLGLGLVWNLLTILGLLVALRACWDCPDPEPVPWLKPQSHATLIGPGQKQQEACVEAVSELGIDLLLPRAADANWWLAPALQVRLNAAPHLPPLRGAQMALQQRHSGARRLSLRWEQGQVSAQRQWQQWLFCRNGCWQQRQARPELLALLALLKQLLKPPHPREAGRRCVIEQRAGIRDSGMTGNRSGQSPLSAR